MTAPTNPPEVWVVLDRYGHLKRVKSNPEGAERRATKANERGDDRFGPYRVVRYILADQQEQS